MKPIEVGCMALVVKSAIPKTVGKCVKVLAFINEGEEVQLTYPGNSERRAAKIGQWLVTADNLFDDPINEPKVSITTDAGIVGKCAYTNSEIIRIDGDPDEVINQKEYEEIYGY